MNYIVKKLLSYGCKVITTSRFPNDALARFKEDPDYDIFKNNLIIYPIDFRIFQSTVKFVNYIKDNCSHIDFLINNAAQTVRRNTEYYEYLLPTELKKLDKEDDDKVIKNDFLSLKKTISEDLINEGSQELSEEQKNEIIKENNDDKIEIKEEIKILSDETNNNIINNPQNEKIDEEIKNEENIHNLNNFDLFLYSNFYLNFFLLRVK